MLQVTRTAEGRVPRGDRKKRAFSCSNARKAFGHFTARLAALTNSGQSGQNNWDLSISVEQRSTPNVACLGVGRHLYSTCGKGVHDLLHVELSAGFVRGVRDHELLLLPGVVGIVHQEEVLLLPRSRRAL